MNLDSADIILLLVSSDFLKSDYCYDIELTRALERHKASSVCVIPIIIRPVDWKDEPFAKLQALPADAIPVTKWTNRDEAFQSIAQGIRRIIEELVQTDPEGLASAPVLGISSPTMLSSAPIAAPITRREIETVPSRPVSGAIELWTKIPFSLDKEQATAKFSSWLNSVWLAPNDFADSAKLAPINAIYVPFFIVNSRASATYQGKRGEKYTVPGEVTKTNERGEKYTVPGEVTKTKWTPKDGEVKHHFEHVAVCGSFYLVPFGKDASILEPAAGMILQPSLSESGDNITVLSPDLDGQSALNKAHSMMEEPLNELAKRDIGGDQQEVLKLTTRFDDDDLKRLLVPAFEGCYLYKGQKYKILINGATGQVAGGHPISRIKQTLSCLVVPVLFLILTLICYFLSVRQH